MTVVLWYGGTSYPFVEAFVVLTILFFITAIYLGMKFNVDTSEPPETDRDAETMEVG